MIFVTIIIAMMISVITVNMGLYVWMQKKQKGAYKWGVIGGWGNTAAETIMLSVVPGLNLMLTSSLLKDAIKYRKELVRKEEERKRKEQLRIENPHWDTIDVVKNITKKYAREENNFYFKKLKPMNELIIDNKNTPAMKFLLETYDESLCKLDAILEVSSGMELDKRSSLCANGEKLLGKLYEEVQNFQKNIETLQKEAEQRTYERMMGEIEQEAQRHRGDYLTKVI